MRIVVTGATGNVGGALVGLLAGDDRVDEVIGVARRPPAKVPQGARFESAEVATDDLVEVMRGADVVVHLAWLFQPTHRPMVTWRNNALGSMRVFEAAAAVGASALVHASSVGTYSPAPSDDRRVDERWPTHGRPTAAYGREKAYLERVLDAYEAHHPDMRVVRMRPAFIFRRESATSQRRLFMGPFAPRRLVRPGRVPLLPHPEGLRTQSVHTDDVAEAYRLAAFGDARGAFNLAAEPVLGAAELAEILGARPIAVPRTLVRAAVAAAWHAHLVPADPHLFDLFLQLPVMDTTRARTELGWVPRRSATEAITEALHAMAGGEGGPTAPLAPDRPDRRLAEVTTGVGERP